MQQNKKSGFGAAAVFLTSISSILGAILFLRFGFATGTLGFWGTIAIILVGHTITIPTALAISELATNTRVEGGGEYFIISRSFGFKIGSTIGITLFLAQAISIAFYTIAFAESFGFLFEWCRNQFAIELPKQVISIPMLLFLAYIILKKGSGSGMILLYIVNIILFLSLILFFFGNPVEVAGDAISATGNNFGFFNRDQFFIVFAICFPAFTGMTAGVGLSGDLRNPGKSIPIGTMLGTFTGLIVYIFVVWKLSVSASQTDLLTDHLIMSRIALFGAVIIPIGLAACTSSSAIGSMMVAPRTLQAIAADKTFPFKRLNAFLSRENSKTHEPKNASILSFSLALLFVILGDVNSVAVIISMFFLITYGALCANSFLNHFGSSPSYRPRFRSKWYFSLAGFLLSVWVMFMISPLYTIIAYSVIFLIYLFVEHHNKGSKGLVTIFQEALFQLNRQLHVYIQKHKSVMDNNEWRPAILCVSAHSFERDKILELMKWISHRHGFGTYFHLMKGYYGKQTYEESNAVLEKLISTTKNYGSTLYIDTMVSPSYTSAIAQIIQTPSISGMENNMVIFEYDKNRLDELHTILENIGMVRSGHFDIGILAISERIIRPTNGIHIWLRDHDGKNTNFMILLGYIILSHPDWRKSQLKIFVTSTNEDFSEIKVSLNERIAAGRLPITMSNIDFIMIDEEHKFSDMVAQHSSQAGLTIIGFHEDRLKYEPENFFTGFKDSGDILFVNSFQPKIIS